MTTMLLAFLLMLVLVGAMAIGVLMGRKPIQGSCGGLAQVGVDGACEICGKEPNSCASDADAAQTVDALAPDNRPVDATRRR